MSRKTHISTSENRADFWNGKIAPAQAVIEYEVRPIDGLTGVKNEFTGYPNPKSDEAWAGLMEGR